MTIPQGSPASAYQPARDALGDVVATFEKLYTGLVYGSAELAVTKDAVITDPRIGALLYDHGCSAAEAAADGSCAVDRSHPWFPMVATGLDNMVIFALRSAKRLVKAQPADLTPMNSDFAFVVRRTTGAGEPRAEPWSPALRGWVETMRADVPVPLARDRSGT